MSSSRRQRLRCATRVAILVCLAVTTPAACGAGDSGAGVPDRIAIEQFLQRTGEYALLRERAAVGHPPLEETTSPGEIGARERELAAAIRAARPHAKAGDVFGSARKPLAEIARRDWLERVPAERQALRDEQPPVAVPSVNEIYPPTLPLATVPPKLLETLPELPEGLDYRFVGPHLILLDVEANLVVDVAPNLLNELR